MQKSPLVTFVIPAYNVEAYLSQTVKSVQAQTIRDWSMIIVDDGSTDRTYAIAKEFSDNDPRIFVMQMPMPSGSAYQPRKVAIESTGTDLVAPLDADDYVDADYLERLLEEKKGYGVDAVYPTMWETDGKNSVAKMDPRLCGQAMTGKESVAFTLDGWRINCNGGVINREIYLKAFGLFDSTLTYSCADELLTRQILWLMRKVKFSTTKYHYRVNPESITRKPTGKQFDYMTNNRELLRFVAERYPAGSEERILAARQNFHGIVDAVRRLREKGYTEEARRYAESQIEQCYAIVDWGFIKKHVSPVYRWVMRGGPKLGSIAMALVDGLSYIKFLSTRK